MGLFGILRDLTGAVGNDMKNNEEDVRGVREKLEFLDYFGEDEKERDPEGRPLQIITAGLDAKTRQFQKDNNLKVDGILKPGGETIAAMNQKLRERNEKAESASGLIPLHKPRIFDSLKHGNMDAVRETGSNDREDDKSYLYQDSEGNVTVAMGRMLPGAKDAEFLNFYKHEKGRKPREATKEEIRAAFDKVKKAKTGYLADHYDPEKEGSKYSNLQIPQESRNAMALSDLVYHADRLRKKFDNFDRMDVNVQKALLDMHYNLGEGEFRRKNWDKLFRAVDEGDWETAARESRRNKINEERNAWTAKQFRAVLSKNKKTE